MRFSFASTAVMLAATCAAKDVSCRVDGKEVAQVDLDSGKCPFKVPSQYPVNFKYKSDDEYLVDAYYVKSDDKYWNDIEGAGRTISVPAKSLYNQDAVSLYHVHDEHTPASNSSSAMRKRFNAHLEVRADTTAVVDEIKKKEGEAISVKVSVVDATNSSSSAAPSSAAEGTVTHTNSETTVVTITSCDDNKCQESTATSQWGPTTVTVSDQETVYTTWCPISTATQTNTETTMVTVTSCADDKCQETTKPATWGPTTSTVEGTETVYTTWCPVETETKTNTHSTIVTITSCADNECHEHTKPATWGPTTSTVEGTETVYTTWCPVSEEPKSAPSTAPPQQTSKPTTLAPEESTQTHTIYSTVVCENDNCETKTKTGVQTVVTSTVNGESTIYTTVCPEELTSTPAQPAPSSKPEQPAQPGTTQPASPAPSSKPEQPAPAPSSEAPKPQPTTQPTQPAQPAQSSAPPAKPEQPAGSQPAQPAPSAPAGTTKPAQPAPSAPGATNSPSTENPIHTLLTSSVAAESSPAASSPAVNTIENGAAAAGSSLLALVAIPLAYFL